jgi:hypothetical protein
MTPLCWGESRKYTLIYDESTLRQQHNEIRCKSKRFSEEIDLERNEMVCRVVVGLFLIAAAVMVHDRGCGRERKREM